MGRGFASKLLGDAVGLNRAIGPTLTAKWLANVAREAPAVLKSRTLLPADARMGAGPFTARHGPARTVLHDPHAFSSIREMWARDVYSIDGDLGIQDGGLIVDLGANMGHFSVLALQSAPNSRCIAVEPRADLWEKTRQVARRNRVEDRLTECRAFIGEPGFTLDGSLTSQPEYAGAEVIEEAAFIERYGIEAIDFLKCDIEGAEVFLLHPDSRLLSMTRRVAMEAHRLGECTPERMIDKLKAEGFTILREDWEPLACTVIAERR